MKTGIDAIDLGPSGTALMTELTNGIRAGFPELRAAAIEAAAIVAGPIESKSPPKVGPLRTIDQWGASLMDTWLEGFERSASSIRLAADEAAGSLGRHLSPALALATAPGDPGSARPEAGDSTTFNVTIQGQPLYAETPVQIVQQLRRVARFGSLSPRRRASWRREGY
jgi:hypothetical protein